MTILYDERGRRTKAASNKIFAADVYSPGDFTTGKTHKTRNLRRWTAGCTLCIVRVYYNLYYNITIKYCNCLTILLNGDGNNNILISADINAADIVGFPIG